MFVGKDLKLRENSQPFFFVFFFVLREKSLEQKMNSSVDCPRSIENISELWDKNLSNQSIMLVLPDTLRSKYYLKDYSGNLQKREARNQREMIRYEYLSHKIASEEMNNQKKKIEIELSYEKKCTKGLVERFAFLWLFFVPSCLLVLLCSLALISLFRCLLTEI